MSIELFVSGIIMDIVSEIFDIYSIRLFLKKRKRINLDKQIEKITYQLTDDYKLEGIKESDINTIIKEVKNAITYALQDYDNLTEIVADSLEDPERLKSIILDKYKIPKDLERLKRTFEKTLEYVAKELCKIAKSLPNYQEYLKKTIAIKLKTLQIISEGNTEKSKTDFLILTPLPEEWDSMNSRLTDSYQEKDQYFNIRIGKIGSYQVHCVLAGKGEKKIISVLNYLVAQYKPKRVLLVGVALALLVYRFIKPFTLKRMGEIEFFPFMHNRGCIDFLNRQQNSLLEFLLGIHTDMFQGCSCHLAKESLNQIQP